MIATRYSWAALAAAMLTVTTARADDTTKRLVGAGSMRDAATTTNLKGTGDADNMPVCCWWKRYAYCAPVYPPVAYAAPAYYAPPTYYTPAPVTGPPPAAGPATYYSPAQPTVAVAIARASRPAIVVGYQGRFFSGSVALRPAARVALPPRQTEEPLEIGPRPRPNDSFRYDGGPSRPVPLPSPDPISPIDPVPTTVPALNRVMYQRSKPNVSYPAYGERPAKKPVVIDPLLVRRTTNP